MKENKTRRDSVTKDKAPSPAPFIDGDNEGQRACPAEILQRWLLGLSLGVKQSTCCLEQAECTLVSELEILVLSSMWHTHLLIQETS